MTQEEKQLLLKDLCARLPYGVKVRIELPLLEEEDYPIEVLSRISIDLSTINGSTFGLEETKPYLRPMSSMTEEEKEYVKNRWCCEDWYDIQDFLNHYQIDTCDVFDFVYWLNENMFDYRGLIPMGLAIEAPDGMYNQ